MLNMVICSIIIVVMMVKMSSAAQTSSARTHPSSDLELGGGHIHSGKQ
jgi:hypothetical protein